MLQHAVSHGECTLSSNHYTTAPASETGTFGIMYSLYPTNTMLLHSEARYIPTSPHVSYPLQWFKANGYVIVGAMTGGFFSYRLGRWAPYLYGVHFYDEFRSTCKDRKDVSNYGPECDLEVVEWAERWLAARRKRSLAGETQVE